MNRPENSEIPLFGFYRGTVLQHLTHGYCKIFIYGAYPPEWKDNIDLIPVAEQASSLFAGTNTGSGVFTYPNIGSTVWCFFANNDQNYPVYFASSLGGDNAFGQYELIKKPSEDISKRHLVTSGKTHIEWYENGKISACVVDPDRREASVDFNNDYQAMISDDHVVNRRIQDLVDKNEISNINCQIVMDNHENSGEISTSTHLYDFGNTEDNIYLSDTQESFQTQTKFRISTDTNTHENNAGVFDQNILSSNSIDLQSSYANATTQVLSSKTQSLSNEVRHRSRKDVDNDTYDKKLSSCVQTSTKMYVDSVNSINVNEQKTDQTSIKSAYLQDKYGTTTISGSSEIEKSSLVNSNNPLEKYTEVDSTTKKTSTKNSRVDSNDGFDDTQLECSYSITANYAYTQLAENGDPIKVILSTQDMKNSYDHATYCNISGEQWNTTHESLNNKLTSTYTNTQASESRTSCIDEKHVLDYDNSIYAKESYVYDGISRKENVQSSLTIIDSSQQVDNKYQLKNEQHANVEIVELDHAYAGISQIKNETKTTSLPSQSSQTIENTKLTSIADIDSTSNMEIRHRSLSSFNCKKLEKTGSSTTTHTHDYYFQNAIDSDKNGELSIGTKIDDVYDDSPVEKCHTDARLFSRKTKQHDTGYQLCSENTISKVSAYYAVDTSSGKIDEQILDKKYNTKFKNQIDTITGKLEITIKDLENGTYCTFTLDKSGNAKLDTSKSITLTSSTIKIKGDTVQITGSNGDCKIKNVSLLQHKHVEMQSGDVVVAGSTLTKTATQSN